MAKKFMYVCFGILALAVTFHVGAQYGKASIVDHTMSGIVAVDGYRVLLDNGEVWQWGLGNWRVWSYTPEYDLPVSVSAIKFWESPDCFYTWNNEVWVLVEAGWTNFGSPGSATTTAPSTWGEIKAKFGGTNEDK